MASLTSPVLANHRKPRGSIREDDAAEQTKKTTSELQEALKNWKLPPDIDSRGQLGVETDEDSAPGYSDSDDENDSPITLRDKVLGLMSRHEAEIKSEKAYAWFATKHFNDLSAQIRKDNDDKNHLGTLLHYLIQAGAKPNWRAKVWVKFILDVAQHIKVPILQGKTSGGNTCLHVAIENRDTGLPYIKFICAIADNQDLAHAIAIENARDLSCIDLAIAEMYIEERTCSQSEFRLPGVQILQELTRKAAPDILARSRRMKIRNNSDGIENLPLHDLVHINLCRDFQRKCSLDEALCSSCQKHKVASEHYRSAYLDILDTMVEKCPEALTRMNRSRQSPFLFHCYTRNNEKSTKDWGQLEFSESVDVSVLGADGRAKVGLPPQPPPRTKDVYRHGQVKDDPGLSLDRTNGGEQPSLTHRRPEVGYSQTLATIVSRKLLELCLSQKSFSDVCGSSFGEKFPSSELIFKAAPLTDKTVDLHSNLPLEPMLACVEVGLDETRTPPRHVEGQSRKDREVRETRVQRLFDWIRRKGVKRIVRLVVYDHPLAPCRDDVIRSCLKGFDVRYLDWNKEDLSVDMLQHVAPRLQELWLTWSGRKSALLGWCNEKYGLRLLKQLGTLYVSTGIDWESQETNRRDLDEFKNILMEADNMPDLEVKDADETTFDSDDRVESQGVKAGNIWIEAIKTFRKALMTDLAKTKGLTSAMNGVIKVAIIDDGVDLEDLTTTKYITGGWYPDRRAPDRRLMNAWYISEKKHGTEMAKLIQLVWPFLNLYIAKLDTTRRVYKSVAASAAEAINKAIDNGANVISMSWTIYQSPDPNDDGLAKMKEAMTKAEKKNILMFCASQDSGFSGHRKPYPATNRNPMTVKRIGSAGIYGERSEYVNPDEVEYLFPGEVAMSEKQVCSGSSAATALAAGLAGLILWCCALQEKRRALEAERLKAAAKSADATTKDAGLMKPPLRRASSKWPTAAPPPPMEPVDFQNYERMYGLFDVLKSSEQNPLVNITKILHEAAASEDPARELVRKCRNEAHRYFEKGKSGPA